MTEPVEFAWLSSRILRPVRGDGPPLAADRRRLFRETVLVQCPTCRGRGRVGDYDGDGDWEDGAWTCAECATYGALAQGTPIVDRPPVPELLSADPEGVLRAEAAARTSVERLSPWGVPAADRVVWRVGGPLPAPMRATMPHQHAENLRRLLFQEWRAELGAAAPHEYVPGLDSVSRFADRAAWHLRLDRAWRRAGELGLTVPVSTGRPAVAGQSMAGLPNPFAPLVEIWAAGYAFADIVDGAIHLIAPAFDFP